LYLVLFVLAKLLIFIELNKLQSLFLVNISSYYMG